jgi:aminopeptidase N
MPRTNCSFHKKHIFDGWDFTVDGDGTEEHRGDGFFVGRAEKHYAPDVQIEPKNLDIAIDLDIHNKTANFSVVITVVNKSTKTRTLNLNGIGFRNLTVEKQSDHDLEWTYDGEIIQVTWTKPFEKLGEGRKFAVKYTVTKPVTGLNFSVPDKEYPQRPLFAITDNESERARYWLACVDYPVVRPTVDFHITAAEGMTIVANGKEMNKETKDGKVTSHWHLPYPCPSYLTCFAVGDFILVKDREVNGIPIAYLTPKGTKEDDLRRTFKETPKIMEFLQKRLGVPFPFTYKYYQIIVPKIGGAMENITLTTWDQRFLCDEQWARDFQLYTDEVNCHEMTHSYFGDSVVIRHFEHVWMKESWATYMESCWLESERGHDEFVYEMFLNAKSYMTECESYMRPLVERRYNHSWALYDSHTYPGGAWRIHMLRRLLGEEAFWSGVKEYLMTYAKSVAETDDFRKMLEKHSGLNLTKFFDQWFYSRGYPKLKGTYKYNVELKKVTVTLEQTQMDTKTGVGLFDTIEPEIEIVDEKNQRYIDKIKFEGSVGAVTLSVANKPVSIEVDPSDSLLFALDFNPGIDLLTHTMTNSKSVAHRIWAAKELIKNGSFDAMEKVKEAMRVEKFYGVHTEIAAALANSKSPFALDVLTDMLLNVQHPMAKSGVALACINLRHPKLKEALETFLKELPSLPYRALSYALEALGNQMDEKSVSFLLEMANKPEVKNGHLGLVFNGVLKGLARTYNAHAWEYLRQAIEYGAVPEVSRPTAILAFADIAQMDQRNKLWAVSKLESLLSEEDITIKKAAIQGLARLQSKSSVGAIEATLVSHQDKFWVQRQINSIQNVDVTIRDLRKDIDDLNNRLKQLEKEIAVLKAEKKN